MTQPRRQRLGRDALLDAASVLMDEHGVDGVSLNEIGRASGHQNRSAVSYHFGDREAIVRALIERTSTQIDAERNTLFDHLETTGKALTVRTLIEASVSPLSSRLRTAEGRRYLRLIGQVVESPRYVRDVAGLLSFNSSTFRATMLLRDLVPPRPPAIQALRGRLIVGVLIRGYADQARMIDTDPPPPGLLGVEDFTTALVDLLMGLVEARSTVELDDR